MPSQYSQVGGWSCEHDFLSLYVIHLPIPHTLLSQQLVSILIHVSGKVCPILAIEIPARRRRCQCISQRQTSEVSYGQVFSNFSCDMQSNQTAPRSSATLHAFVIQVSRRLNRMWIGYVRFWTVSHQVCKRAGLSNNSNASWHCRDGRSLSRTAPGFPSPF